MNAQSKDTTSNVLSTGSGVLLRGGGGSGGSLVTGSVDPDPNPDKMEKSKNKRALIWKYTKMVSWLSIRPAQNFSGKKVRNPIASKCDCSIEAHDFKLTSCQNMIPN